MATASNDEVIAMSETIGRLLYTLDRLPIVTIAVIEGAAMAGGSGRGLLLRCHDRHCGCEICFL